MKISCTIDEFKTIVEACYGNRLLRSDACANCVFGDICANQDGIAADIEIVKED